MMPTDLVAEENVPITAEESETGPEENDDGDEMIADLEGNNPPDDDFLIIRRHDLLHLSAMDLLRFRSVFPDWNRLISDPFFALSHSLQPHSVSGLFFHDDNNNNSPNYYPFDAHHHSIPNPTLSFLPEPVVVKSSTRGLLCCRGKDTSFYYVANPTTAAWTRLPPSTIQHPDGSAVAVVFDEPSYYNFDFNYCVAVAYPISDGHYCFESFSSATWAWRVGAVCAAEEVVGRSGVAAGGWAYWRTTMGPVLGYQPSSDTWRLLNVLPPGVDGNPWWELGEMDGRLAVTCARGSEVEVHMLEDRAEVWNRVGNFREEEARPVLRSQGKEEVLMLQDTRVVVRDLNGRVLREVVCVAGAGGLLPSEFIPYVSTLVDVRRRDKKTE